MLRIFSKIVKIAGYKPHTQGPNSPSQARAQFSKMHLARNVLAVLEDFAHGPKLTRKRTHTSQLTPFPKHKSLPLSLKHFASAAIHRKASSLLPAVNPPSPEPMGGLSLSSLGLGLFKEECSKHKGPLLRPLL